MTIKELVAKLSEFDEKAEVVGVDESGTTPILEVNRENVEFTPTGVGYVVYLTEDWPN